MPEKTLSLSKEEKQRTELQNNSLHKYCELLSEALFEAGITQKKFLEAMNEIHNSPESIKAVFRQYGKEKYGKKSTAGLTTKEISDIYEEFNLNLSKIGIHIPWPSSEEQMFKTLSEEMQ